MTHRGQRGASARARYRARMNHQRRAQLLDIAEASASVARTWVAEHLEREGTGPTWRELSNAMGWPWRGRRNLGRAIGMLILFGWLEHEPDVERSLRPGVPPAA